MEIANKSQAENGVDNQTIMTPLRVKQSIAANGGSGPTVETDPIFSSSPAHSITNENINSWNAAEPNVQSDWNQTNTSADDYIKNKPTIPVIPQNLAYTNQDNDFSTGQTINGYLAVKDHTYLDKDVHLNDEASIQLRAEGPSDTNYPPTNKTGIIEWTQWKEEAQYEFREITKASISVDDSYSTKIGPNFEAYSSNGTLVVQDRLALEQNTMPITSVTFNSDWVTGLKPNGDYLNVIIPFTNPYKKSVTANITGAQGYIGYAWQNLTFLSNSIGVFETFVVLRFDYSGLQDGSVYLIKLTGSISI